MKIAASRFWGALLTGAVVASLAAGATGDYHLLKKIAVGGQGGWDYLALDEGTRRLYVSHQTQVEVLDADSGAVVGKIANTQGVHGIAIASNEGRGFISDGATGTVTMFDLKTLKPLGEVKVGQKPDAIIFDAGTHRVFAFNGKSESATAMEAADGKVAGTVALGGGPEFAVSDGKGTVFVNIEDKNEMVRIDARKLTATAHWPLAPCEAPSSMAIDRGSRRLFVGCRSHVMAVVSADDGHVITTLPIADHVDATAFDAETGMIFNSTGEGVVNVFHEDGADKYSAVETIKTHAGSKTMALDPKTHNIFLPANDDGTFTIMVFGK